MVYFLSFRLSKDIDLKLKLLSTYLSIVVCYRTSAKLKFCRIQFLSVLASLSCIMFKVSAKDLKQENLEIYWQRLCWFNGSVASKGISCPWPGFKDTWNWEDIATDCSEWRSQLHKQLKDKGEKIDRKKTERKTFLIPSYFSVYCL